MSLAQDIAARILDVLASTDEHGNTLYRATAPLYVQRIDGDLVELASALELQQVCEAAVHSHEEN